MSLMDNLSSLVDQYTRGGASEAEVHDTYDKVAAAVPHGTLAGGLSHSFKSDQTPPFEQMVGHLFGQSDPNQRAGLLNTMIGSLGPTALSPGALPGLAGVLGGGQGQVTPQQASQIPPQAVQQIAAQAQQQNPGIIDTISGFYSQHPTLVKSLGAGALAMLLSHMGRQQDSGQVLPASQDPYGDPADQMQGADVLPASMDPQGDPADQYQGQQVLSASQDPYGDPADEQSTPTRG